MSESLKIIADKMILFEQQQQVIAEQNRRIAYLEGEIQALKEPQQTAKQQQQLEAPKASFFSWWWWFKRSGN